MKGCRGLSDAEIEQCLPHFERVRDRVMFLCGILTGVRVSQLLSLRINQVTDEQWRVGEHVSFPRRTRKGKVEGQNIRLHPEAVKYIQELVDHLRAQGYKKNTFLFRAGGGCNRPIGRDRAYRLVRDVFKKAKLSGKLGTHSWRKTFGQRFYKLSQNNLMATMEALGQKDVRSTQHYLGSHLDVVEAVIPTMRGRWESD